MARNATSAGARSDLATSCRSLGLSERIRSPTYRSGFEVRTYRLCRRVLMLHHFAEELGVGRLPRPIDRVPIPREADRLVHRPGGSVGI